MDSKTKPKDVQLSQAQQIRDQVLTHVLASVCVCVCVRACVHVCMCVGVGVGVGVGVVVGVGVGVGVGVYIFRTRRPPWSVCGCICTGFAGGLGGRRLQRLQPAFQG